MGDRIADSLHVATALIRAGVAKPSRPDRSLRALWGLRRWGPTLAAGYLGAAARYPGAAAIADELGVLTFADVEARTNALARGLSDHGVQEGDRIALMCRNHRWFIEASVACAKLGAHAVYLNTAFAGPQLTAVLGSENPAAVIYDQEFTSALEPAFAGRLGFLAWRDGTTDAGHGGLGGSAGVDHPTLEEVIDGRMVAPLTPPTDPGRTVILTSGTTGTPKGANRASPGSLGPAAALLSAIPLRARETTVIAAPMFHSWGFAHMFLSTALSSTLVLRRRFDPADTLRAIAEHRASALIVVPVMLARMLELGADAVSAYELSSLRLIAASGSALPGPLAQDVMDVFGEKLYNLYGSTEVAWATVASPQDLRAAPGTAGRPPRGTVVKILDPESHLLPAGVSGRIFVGSEMLFEGYTGGGDKLRLGDLMSTGDMGHFDDRGRLFVDGRDDDMIVSGGENVFPSEVENLLAALPGIREVAVVGVPDPEFGQRLRAVVALEREATLTERELQDHVRRNLARYKVPREVRFVDELPRNATGKVLKRELV
jgi:fatty-acyl-CoA synthase